MSGLLAASMLENKPALDFIVTGLNAMKPEERDSSGVAMVIPKGIRITRTMNALQALDHATGADASSGFGITEHFTKYAIQPLKCFDRLVIGFEGELINMEELIDLVTRKGYDVRSLADVPGAIISSMLHWYMTTEFMELGLVEALSLTMEDLRGYFSIAAIDHHDKNTIVLSRKSDDMYIGASENGVFASTSKEAFDSIQVKPELLEDNSIVVLRNGECMIYDYKAAYEVSEA